MPKKEPRRVVVARLVRDASVIGPEVVAQEGPVYGSHPDAQSYAAWYLASVRCQRDHGRGLFGRFPCEACLKWSAEQIVKVLASHHTPKGKPSHAKRSPQRRRPT